MEQFLRDFFNDNSVCVGLCDLKRKTSTSMPQQTFVNKAPQPKPQKQTLAQKFAAQQQAYAAQQAYVAQQRQKYAQVQQQMQQRVVQQKPIYSEAKPVFVSKNPYCPQATPQQNPQVKVIVNGNTKKIVSAAVPAGRYNNR